MKLRYRILIYAILLTGFFVVYRYYQQKTADSFLSQLQGEVNNEFAGAQPRVNHTPQGAPVCDDTLWNHVYNPSRLIIHDKCTTVTGTIMDATNGKSKDGVRHEADGDTHGWLKLDPQFASMINKGNTSAENGNLVFEIVCHFKITQHDAIAPCGTFKDTQVIPPVGSHVAMTGSYVQDTNHAKWMEIHPVSKIVVIP